MGKGRRTCRAAQRCHQDRELEQGSQPTVGKVLAAGCLPGWRPRYRQAAWCCCVHPTWCASGSCSGNTPFRPASVQHFRECRSCSSRIASSLSVMMLERRRLVPSTTRPISWARRLAASSSPFKLSNSIVSVSVRATGVPPTDAGGLCCRTSCCRAGRLARAGTTAPPPAPTSLPLPAVGRPAAAAATTVPTGVAGRPSGGPYPAARPPPAAGCC